MSGFDALYQAASNLFHSARVTFLFLGYALSLVAVAGCAAGFAISVVLYAALPWWWPFVYVFAGIVFWAAGDLQKRKWLEAREDRLLAKQR
jgi:hypothetical protein